jgi:hypothetical protein
MCCSLYVRLAQLTMPQGSGHQIGVHAFIGRLNRRGIAVGSSRCLQCGFAHEAAQVAVNKAVLLAHVVC